VDLSGDAKTFVVDDHRVALRETTPGDLDDLLVWRSDPDVRRWWSPGELAVPAEELRRKYAERVAGRSPTRMWVVEINGRSAGFVQDYRIGDYPDYAMLGPDPDAIGLDYAIGAAQWRGRGLGQRVIWCWMLHARTRFPQARSYFAAPDHRNAASLRVLAKAGFVEGLWFDEPQEDGEVHTVVGCTLDVATVIG
jgi:aminoglycoside 6'-N-acetyltransferase